MIRYYINFFVCIFLLLIVWSQQALAQRTTSAMLFQKNDLTIYPHKAQYRGAELYNGEKDLDKLKQSEDAVQCPLSYTYYYNPLSLVGDYFGYERGEYGQFACGPPTNFLAVQTVQLKTRSTITLTDLFDEKEIADALRKDKWILEQMDQETIVRAISLHDLLQRINSIATTSFKETSFAISSYDKKTKLAAVRLVSSTYVGFDHYYYVQIELRMRPLEQKLKAFEAEWNFYLSEFKNGLSAPGK